MKVLVRVLHNVSPDMFIRYNPETSKLFHAHDFEVVADNFEKAADVVWTLANVDDAQHLRSMRSDLGRYADQVTAYRDRRNRSLSVSDVLVFQELEPGESRAAVCVEMIGHRAVQDVKFTAGTNDTPLSESYMAHVERSSDPGTGLRMSGGD